MCCGTSSNGEKRCAEAEEDDIEFPVEEINETRLIEGDSHEFMFLEWTRMMELVFLIDADGPLDVIICDEADAEAWSDGEVEGGEEEDDDDEDDRALQPAYMHLTGLSECLVQRSSCCAESIRSSAATGQLG